MDKKRSRFIPASFFLVLAVLSIAAGFLLSNKYDAYRNKDFFTFWLGGRMAVQGQDVYEDALWVEGHAAYDSTWIENRHYVYPLYTALVFAPLGALPVDIAAPAWITLCILMVVVSIVICLSFWHYQRWRAFAIVFVIGSILFRPVFLTVLEGQIDALILLLLALGLYLLIIKKPIPAMIALSLTMLKPNIGLPILGCVGVWLLVKRQWKEVLAIFAVNAFLIVPPLLVDPLWISKYLDIGLHKSQDAILFPNLRGLSGLVLNSREPGTTLLWLAVTGLLLLISFLFCLRNRKVIQISDILLLAIPLTLLATPYLRAYDLVLLLVPILYLSGRAAQANRGFTWVVFSFLGWGLLSLAFLFLAVPLGHDIFSVCLSLLVLFGILVALKKDLHQREAVLSSK